MNLNLLQAFQTAVNEHGMGDGNKCMRMHRRDDNQSCCVRVVPADNASGDSNREVRCAFKQALTSAFGSHAEAARRRRRRQGGPRSRRSAQQGHGQGCGIAHHRRADAPAEARHRGARRDMELQPVPDASRRNGRRDEHAARKDIRGDVPPVSAAIRV